MDSKEIRLINMRDLADRAGSKSALARKMDVSAQLVQNYIGRTPTKSIGSEMARRAEAAFGLPHGWLDNDHSKAMSVLSDWPFIGISASEWESASERVKGVIEGYARSLIDQESRRSQESQQESSKRAA